MKRYIYICAKASQALGVMVVSLLVLGLATSVQGQPAFEEGMEVLTRGPVHEAFAAASMAGATAGAVITRAPYEPIAELPPDQRPEGDNVAWIPGYWGWDDDRNDYIWVSGVWRNIPPGRQWVPGYWAPVSNGVQWISGFWGEVAQSEVAYLPQPPETLDIGPSSPAPGPDNSWTQGSWIWQQSRYNWQPGYWVAQRPDWVWTPAHYIWTPRGHVYVPGYWDYDIVNRGVMFAPVYYSQPLYRRSGYYYSPSIAIDLGVVLTSFFVQPRSRHYYYGDYYDQRYEERGFYPWYSRQSSRYGNDPLYAHYRSRQILQNSNWDAHIADQFRYRRDHVEARPPQTLALQVNIYNQRTSGAPEGYVIGRNYSEMIQSRTQPLRFKSVSMDERRQMKTRGREVHKLQSERARIEAEPGPETRARASRGTAKAVRMELPRSPVAARPIENVKGARVPPPEPVSPKLKSRGRAVKSRTSGVQQSETRAMPQRDRPASEMKSSLPTQQRSVPHAASSRRVKGPARTKSESHTPQTAEPTQLRGRAVRQETQPQSPKVQSRRTSVESRGAPEIRQRTVAPEVQSQRSARIRDIKTPSRLSPQRVRRIRENRKR